ncbi:MAG: HD domain-containing protein [Pyrinomonadaceae bacterium]|nr:HD domain-containing protein [Sphingobacteriaceae bacterium]
MIYQQALARIKVFVQNYFAEHLNPNRIYHNLQHTQNVVELSLQIANHYKLDSKSLFIIETAAWFHDIGYSEAPAHHEKRGTQIAEKYLKELSIDDDYIKSVKGCIMATRIPQQPKTLLERIICDADMYHLGLDDFAEKSKLVRKELELNGQKIPKDVWRRKNIELLQNHQFKTDYAEQLLSDQQKKNLEQLLNKSIKRTGEILSPTPSNNDPIPVSTPVMPKPEKRPERPDRGIETMFKISSNNHQALSQMADSKAHIMITVNSIIISVLLSVLFRSLDNEPHLAIPVAILLIVNVVTIVFSILATRPNIPQGNFSKDDLVSKKVNLLFFGNYYKMKLDDFSEGMTQLMEDREFLYKSLIKNLHQQGLVLGYKYKLLRISYNVFMYGLVLSLIAFGVAILIKQL